MTCPIAVVGMACVYPDARSPTELWENALAGRRAFRRMPPERLRVEDYLSTDPNAADRTYSVEAALIEGYAFDRIGFRVAGGTFRSADPAHWLALDVAARALNDAGFGEGEGLPRDATGVFLGNTLTGEFSRANVLRLRWPYVRRVVDAALREAGWSPERCKEFLAGLEGRFKAPFPPVGGETLAGGLSNTIAGRICNHFGLKGGGYTVDGACASSLLAIDHACAALVTGDIDVALAGGVDLSLDPFELVGFAKAGALASEEMRVYDARSAGFWPGEGCGVVVLMRLDDAAKWRRHVAAVIRGWGISSDGQGGITRPEVEGQLLALRRAYRRAGFGIETVAYFEGHGTGTSVGDATELRALSRARREAAAGAPPAVIGSIKAQIGHTKAAAGVAGLIKAAMALRAQILPPTIGCDEPHPELAGAAPALRALSEGEPWPPDRPLRAGVSAMGFGGINAHVVLEGFAPERYATIGPRERALLASTQDAELLLLDAPDVDDLRGRVDHLLTFAAGLSRAEVADLAAQMQRRLGDSRVRAAVVASRPAELADRLATLRSWLTGGGAGRLDPRDGVFLGAGAAAPRVGFLFPGQGSPAHLGGGSWRRRFPSLSTLYAEVGLPTDGDRGATAVAQPAIVTASLAALHMLARFGIVADVAVGHSLGELIALHWAGALEADALLRIAVARGRAMAGLPEADGAMASIAAGRADVEALLDGEPVVIAALNAPRHTVVSGGASSVVRVMARAQARGLLATRLPVSHAFHSPLVAAAAPALAETLSREVIRSFRGTVMSTVTGARLAPHEDVRGLLCRQVTSPVRFAEAVAGAIDGVDLWIEVGPGRVLSGLVAEFVEAPVVPLDAGGPSLCGLLAAVGAAFACGAPVAHDALFAGRFTRPFDLNWHPRFFANPCESAPVPETGAAHEDAEGPDGEGAHGVADSSPGPLTGSPLDLVRQLVAARAELPPSAVDDGHRLLSDLHLNSIAVAQLVAEAARHLGLPPPIAPTHYADATVYEVAQILAEIARTGDLAPASEAGRSPSGVDSWVRAFTVVLVDRPLPQSRPPTGRGCWRVIASADDPLRDALGRALAQWGGRGGIAVCLPPEPDENHLDLLLEGARAVLAAGEATQFVVVQHGGGGGAFARSLHLEAPGITTCVVDVPPDHPKAVEWVVAEAGAAVGYAEAHYDPTGRRREPALRLLPAEDAPAAPALGQDDVVLVTAGGKGITAECALALAREGGVRLALLGRSQPAADVELAANLRRVEAAGIPFRYIAADVTDAEAVRAAVREAEAALGPITAIVHGAGANVPQWLATLDRPAFLHTLAPKVRGAKNLLAAVDPGRLRHFVTFGSIIARTGMRGEAHYALANEWLAHLTERLQAEHPTCRCLAVEWSVWSGLGMGERLGRVDALMREGITPITPQDGVAILRRLVARSSPAVSVVVAGRFGDAPTLEVERPDLLFLRFLERPRVHYPGVELVVDAELTSASDPYLEDHVFRGERLFPAVMGLEAMAQAASAVLGASEVPLFEDVRFDRPVSVPEGGSSWIRLAALARGPGRVEVVLRSQSTAFQVDHFRATCCFGTGVREPGIGDHPTFCPDPGGQATSIPIDPGHDLYGAILFHGGRFCRLQGYRRLAATECLAEIAPGGTTEWFGRYLPPDLLLGDPAARDAAVHAIQACIPHVTLLPIGVERLLVLDAARTAGHRLMHARERSREGDTFIYDLEVTGADGRVIERWEGLRLRAVRGTAFRGPWIEPLLAPYLERRVRELIPGSAAVVVVERGPTGERQGRSDRAFRQALGQAVPIRRRPDGKPEGSGDRELSAAHAGDLTLAVAGRGPLGCDVEPVAARPASVWRDLLGPERFTLSQVVAREAEEDQDTAATRVWAASECLVKAGAMIKAPLVLKSSEADGSVLLAAGPLMIATFVASIRALERRLVLAVGEERPCEPMSSGT